jgi:tetratricopeptide (TPR) repeat protein
MKAGALGRKRFEDIEDYVLERMEAPRRHAFEQDLATDAGLREELELERDNILAVELAGFERTLKSIAAAGEGPGQVHRGRTVWLRAAAAAAVLVGALAWWFSRPPLNERLFAQAYVTDPGLPVPMSTLGDPAFQDAMVAYKLEDYAEAEGKWERLLKAAPGNDTLAFYIASAELAQGKAGEAVPHFREVAVNASSAFQGKARWFLYLAYLQSGDREAMRQMDMAKDPEYGERAREIEAQMQP